MKERVFYYTDPLRDDFAGTDIATKPLPESYVYIPKNPLRRAAAWVLHHCIATPVCFLILKLLYGQKIVGRSKLRPYRRTGYFLYGNHTRAAGDAFTPSMAAFPKKPYVLVNPDAVSIPFLKRLVEDLGGMPVPDSFELQKKLVAAIRARMQGGGVVAIYPEAHIWPLYTGVRPFSASSFVYPVDTKKPAFAFTATYKKRKFFGGVKATVYVDGPFFPDETLPRREQKLDLRERVYAAMTERSALSVWSPNRFLPADPPDPVSGQ